MSHVAPDHLVASFDPSKALVSQLRSILLSHNVPYAANAKKPQLVALYEQHVRPIAPRLLAEHAAIRPSADGILDGESQNGSLAELDTDSELERRSAQLQGPRARAQSKSSTRRKAANRKKLVRHQENDELTGGSGKLFGPPGPESPDQDNDGHASSSRASPRKRKAEENTRGDLPRSQSTPNQNRTKRDSNFSDYNPFQSGAEDTPDASASKRRRKSSMGPRRPQQNALANGTGRKSMPDMPREQQQSSSPHRKQTLESDVATTDEAAAPNPARPIVAGDKYMVPTTSIKKPPVGVSDIRRRMPQVSPSERQNVQRLPVAPPAPVQAFVRPGAMYESHKSVALSKQSRTWAERRAGAVGMISHTEKLMFVAREASRALNLLRKHRGTVTCNKANERGRKRSSKSDAWVYGLNGSALRQSLRDQNMRSAAPLSEQAHEEIFRLALRDLQEHGETVRDDINGELWIAATSALLPLSCRLRLSAQAAVAKHVRVLLSSIAVLMGVALVRARLQRRLRERKRITALVGVTFGELQKQEQLHAVDPVLAPDAHVIQSHLRDLVLQDEHSPAVRARLWAAVSKIVEANANVRTKQVERFGEEMLAWEWSGSSKQNLPRESLYPSMSIA
ncbi:inner nuclear membrane protein enriched at telomere/subtelomere region [Microbotryomycetes sp. JL201]|nr:inner nuclear membrane protein enriched at telomere/subtelomere region [Microbotryomycetes sp. JL201]